MYPNLLKKVDGTYKYVFPEIGIEISDTSNNKNVEP
jgi:hypothetical protein